MLDKDYIKNNLTLEDVVEILEVFGGEPQIVDDNTIISRTICHNSLDNDPSRKMYYYNNNKVFKCYTGQCDTFDIYSLVEKVYKIQKHKEISFPVAVKFVSSISGIEEYGDIKGLDETEVGELAELLEKTNSSFEKQEDQKLKEYSDRLLKRLPQPYVYEWIKEGISKETADKFGIRYHPVAKRIVIPHYDKDNRLVGIRGRALKLEEQEGAKYMPLIAGGKMYNHPLGFNLYGLNWNKENIKALEKVIVFESEKSVMLAEEYLPNNFSVATCGNTFSNFHFNELLDLGVKEIIIAFDRQFKEVGDEEYKQWTQMIKRTADRYKNFVTITVMQDEWGLTGYKDAPIDCGKEVFLELYNRRMLVR